MANDELTEVVSARLTPAEAEHAKQLGSGSASAGVRRSLRLSSTISGATAAGSARLSMQLEHAAALAADLERANSADVVACSSGAAFVADPSGDVILQVRRATGSELVVTPAGLMCFGAGPGGSDAVFALDLVSGSIAITDSGAPADVELGLDIAGLAAVVDLLGAAHRQAREAMAQGHAPSRARVSCPALQLEIQPVMPSGKACIRLAGQQVEIQPLVFLQLQAESAALLARSAARFDWDRRQLEALLEHPAPAVCWERSHGE